MTINVFSATQVVYELKKIGDHVVAVPHDSPAEFETSVFLVSDPTIPAEQALRVFAKPEGEDDQVVNETTLQPGDTSYMFRGKGFSKIECR